MEAPAQSFMSMSAIIENAVIVALAAIAEWLSWRTRLAAGELVAFGVLAVWIGYQSWLSQQHRQAESMARSEAEASRSRLLALVNSLRYGIIVADHTGRVTLYNGAALELLNTNRSITGKNLEKLAKLTDADGDHTDLWKLSQDAHPTVSRRDLVLRADDGTELALDLQVLPIQSQGGGYVVVMADITRQKTIDEERDELISVVSHELRTPVAIAEANVSTAILPGYAKIEPKAMHLLEQAHDNLVFLGNLIRDLTTLSHAERQSQHETKAAVDLAAMMSQLATNYRPQAAARGLTLVAAIDPGLGTVWSYRDQIEEILQNFITNAIKYTPKGSIRLTATRNRDKVVIGVHDTGIGIAAADRPHVFEKFYRSEDYRTRQTGGTGLGLYIAQKLAKRIGAHISYTSRLGRGSVFILELPIEP